MKEFLFTGGFPGMLTILLLAIIIGLITLFELSRRLMKMDFSMLDKKLFLSIRALGGIALMVGIFWQTLGLYQAFQAIKMAGDISPTMIMGGIFISFYSTLFGLGVYLCSNILWYILKMLFMHQE